MANDDDTPLPKTRKAAKILGSMFYAPGSTCIRGHVAKRRAVSGKCRDCELSDEERKAAVIRVAAWAKTQDPDRLREQAARNARENRLENLEEARAYGRANRLTIPAEVLASRMKSWRSRNAEHVNEYDKAYKKRWRLSNPAKASIKTQAAGARRQAALYAAPGTWGDEDVQWLMAEQGGMCAGFWCDVPIKERFEVDHRDPISRGGSNWPSNLALLCQSCNRRKQASTMPEWFQRLGGYQCPKSTLPQRSTFSCQPAAASPSKPERAMFQMTLLNILL